MYPSDYGYATDLSKCTQNLYNYNDSTCTSNNWMKSIMTSNNWLLTPNSGYSDASWLVVKTGREAHYGVYYQYGVTPVLYLNPEIGVKGTGSSSKPYQISA